MTQTEIMLDLVNGRWTTHQHPVELTFGFAYQPQDTRPPQVLLCDSLQTIWQESTDAPSDGTYPITRRWQSPAMGGEIGQRVLGTNTIAVDYLSAFTSSLTVRVSADRGRTWPYERSMTLPQTSTVSRMEWFMQVPARYPVVEFQSSSTSHALFRAEFGLTVEGR